MANATPFYGTTLSGVAPLHMARVYDVTNAAISQSAISSIAYTVYLMSADYPEDEDAKTAVTGHAAIAVTVASTVYNALQTGGAWDNAADATGYNFKHQPSVAVSACWQTAGRYYKTIYTFTPASGEKFAVEFVDYVKG